MTGTDERHEVNSILEGGFSLPTQKLLCIPATLAEQLTVNMVWHIFQVPSSLPMLILASEYRRPHAAAEMLASHFHLCRVALVPELAGKRNVMLDNRGVVQFLNDQMEELVILVLDHYRILTFLHEFVRENWKIEVPTQNQGVLIDPTTKRVIPIYI